MHNMIRHDKNNQHIYYNFFLGDYRPLIQDANGNVLDQETQLVPYRRNVQDLLCDSSMIPYPDPYQSLYQKRRLGAIGIEWRPPSVKFAVGPTYNTSSGDFQMLPILDLDRWVEPLPELLDAIDWEPENEVQSDDNDSEYNVPEEYSSEGEHGNLSESSSGEPECSAEESGVEYKRKDAPRRSKRKKHKSEVEVTTTSGRRVKRRNLDECEGTSVSRTHSKRRSKNGRLTSKKKSSKSKTLRPQRRAARNALNLFSRIGDSSEEEEDGQFESTSESESEFPDSNTQSIESESMHQSEGNYPRDKAALIDEFEDVAKPSENQANPGRRRLVLKLPLRDSKAAISVENPRSECRGVESMIDAIPKENSDASNLKGTSSTAFQPIQSIGDISDTMMLETVKNNGGGQVDKSDQCILSASRGGSTVKWGEVKARSCKRLKLSNTVAPDACHPSNANLDNPNNTRDDTNGHLKSEDENEMSSNSGNKASLHNNLDRKEWQCGNGALQGLDVASTEERPPEYNFKLQVSQNSSANLSLLDQVAVPLTCNGNITDTLRHIDNKYQDNHDISEASGIHEAIESHCVVTDDKRVCYTTGRNQEVERNTLIFTIKANEFIKETNSLSSKSKYAVEGSKSSEHDLMSNASPPAHQSSISVMPEEDERTTAPSPDHTSAQSPDHSDWNDDASGSLDSWEDKSQFSKRTNLVSHSKRYGSVYKRSKSSRCRRFPENDQRVEESTSKSYNHSNALVGSVRRTRSMGTKTNATRDIVSRREQFPLDDWKSNSKTVGLRSQRNRRESYSSNLGYIDKRKYEQPGRKLSWLMLVKHEESYRYIPQQGDIVAYLRQGHEEYIKDYRLPSKDAVSLKKLALKAVEICKVQQLDYSAVPGSGESCCKLILEFIESSSNSSRKTFKLTLPELVYFPDFLVEKTRYDAAIARNWTYRDKCQVWWRNEVGDGGSWWEGRILAVKPKSPDLPESPWERYVVQYKNDSSEQHSHCPWELHDVDTQWEHPHINVEIRDNLFSLISKLEETSIKKDKYSIQKLNQVAQKSDFLNRFPVPLSIDIIKRRLHNNYYRSLEAVKHDASVMLSNAESYFGKTGEMATKVRRLSVWFADTFSSL
ncbi:Uncharacterized protein M6B38_225925 [Iris pallida]|uniref:Bromo domain-containing protein n=1 Tax=Iris pallida TaxID=29817 RepID=A0AAX6DVA0_IRIPA|nr:Uncharacterized protein M6B38_225925 [Iris pallida]